MDGIVLIDKEKNMTSRDVVNIACQKLNTRHIGHTGTLDPMATGVLPVLIGKGTLLSKYLIDHDKTYLATLKLGIKTDTGDITGDTIKTQSVDDEILLEDNIKNVFSSIQGEQEQIPPMYSAIKVNGKKLYEYARKGLTVKVEPRTIKIYNTEIINIDIDNKEIAFRVSCSKGTYIRTLCETIAEKLGTVGTMKSLDREKVGIFDIKNAIKISEINDNNFSKYFISIEDFFEQNDEIILSPRSYIAYLNGVNLLTDNEDGIYRIYNKDNKFVGTGIVKNGILKRDIVI